MNLRRHNPRIRVIVPGLLLLGATLVIAQDEGGEGVAAESRSLAAEIEHEFDCEIAVRGEPHFDEFANTWLVAYSATGAGCDRATTTLIERGKALGATFFRRPDSSQVKVLIQEVRREVSTGYHCPISIRGEPRLDESSGYWLVRYAVPGDRCDDAMSELSRRGRELQINFVPSIARRDLVR